MGRLNEGAVRHIRSRRLDNHGTSTLCESRSWLDAVHSGRIEGSISCHSLAEYYRVLTAMSSRPRMKCLDVWTHMQQNFESHFQVVALDHADYQACLDRVAMHGLRSGIVFDALIVQAAVKASVDKLLTLNSKHFVQLWPNHVDEVIDPNSTQAP